MAHENLDTATKDEREVELKTRVIIPIIPIISTPSSPPPSPSPSPSTARIEGVVEAFVSVSQRSVIVVALVGGWG
jgi:hypothetical protein